MVLIIFQKISFEHPFFAFLIRTKNASITLALFYVLLSVKNDVVIDNIQPL